MKTGTGNMDELSHTLILSVLTIFSNKMGNVLEPTSTLTIIPEEIRKPHRSASEEFSVNCPTLFHDWGEQLVAIRKYSCHHPHPMGKNQTKETIYSLILVQGNHWPVAHLSTCQLYRLYHPCLPIFVPTSWLTLSTQCYLGIFSTQSPTASLSLPFHQLPLA